MDGTVREEDHRSTAGRKSEKIMSDSELSEVCRNEKKGKDE